MAMSIAFLRISCSGIQTVVKRSFPFYMSLNCKKTKDVYELWRFLSKHFTENYTIQVYAVNTAITNI